MKIRDIVDILDGYVICGEDLLDVEVHSACASDMMSDVLAFVKEQSVLVTGLCNPQVINTAEIMEMCCIVFVREKKPTDMMIELAKRKGIALLGTNHRMFASCGMLYAAGLKPEV